MRKLALYAFITAIMLLPFGQAEHAYMHALAVSGDPVSQYELALYYYEQEHEPETAAEWMEKSAAQGYAEAMDELAYYYYTGQGVERDINKAIEWWTAASAEGSTAAIRHIGYLYETGTGVAKDPNAAFELYAQAAELGDPEGYYSMGYCCEGGIGTEKDEAAAFENYNKAADLGDKEAQYIVAQRLYDNGDPEKAFYYWSLAAEQNEPGSQYALGYLYYTGEYVDKDLNRAREFWEKAALNGHKEAVVSLFKISQEPKNTEVLSLGSSGKTVERIRSILYRIGYMEEFPGENFDPATEAALIEFQRSHGLEATGEADLTTQAFLFYQDPDLYAVAFDSVSIQNADMNPRLFVCFRNIGGKAVKQIRFSAVPIDCRGDDMVLFGSFESILCKSDRPLGVNETDSKGYYWRLDGCDGLCGVRLALSSIEFQDGTVLEIPKGRENRITFVLNDGNSTEGSKEARS